MIVPLAAGGASDATARVLAERMSRSLGQPVIIENVTGADGSIGTARAARSNADGYTIDLGIMSTHVLNGGFYSLSYDLKSDEFSSVFLRRLRFGDGRRPIAL
jgi:tripartite-type tricarboxylate transporter receptor subunit TctC